MEMGKLTAKLRDAVPVCFLAEGKELIETQALCINCEVNRGGKMQPKQLISIKEVIV